MDSLGWNVDLMCFVYVFCMDLGGFLGYEGVVSDVRRKDKIAVTNNFVGCLVKTNIPPL